MALEKKIKDPDKLPCICEGNWRLIVAEHEHLIGKRFKSENGNVYTFFGIVHGSDDYYYGMHGVKGLMLLSCCVSIETHGYKLYVPPPQEETTTVIPADKFLSGFLQYFCDKYRHLVCKPYSIINLHKMAEVLNIDKCWFHKDHYDIPKKRIEEITSKCNIVTAKRILNIIKGVDDTHCPRCGGELKRGVVLINQLSGMSDFIGDDEVVTVSFSGKAKLVEAIKCKKCGYSRTKTEGE